MSKRLGFILTDTSCEFRASDLSITPATKYRTVVIPAKAGIQEGTGCRIKACPGPDPGSGMTELSI
jgi:hypothetical protein